MDGFKASSQAYSFNTDITVMSEGLTFRLKYYRGEYVIIT